MIEVSAEMPALQSPLDKILHAELEAGNEIVEVQRGGWSKVDTIVSLKNPFRKDYREEFPNADFYRNTDTHYSLTDSYSARREAVEAPY